jgi:hypothetical protein
MKEIIEKIIDGCTEVKKNPEIHKDAKDLATLVIKDCNDVLDAFQKLTDSAELNSVPNGWVKKKEWVGLTDAEAMEIEDKSPDIRWAIIQAEAKLKEKNT